MCDAKLLYALEQFMGEKYYSTGDTVHNPSNPNWEATNLLNAAYSKLSDYIYAELESQSALEPLFDKITISYNSANGTLSYDLTNVIDYIRAEIAVDATSGKNLMSDFASSLEGLGLEASSNYEEFYNTFSAMGDDYRILLDSVGRTVIYGTRGNDSLDGSADGQVYLLDAGNDTIYFNKFKLPKCA